MSLGKGDVSGAGKSVLDTIKTGAQGLKDLGSAVWDGLKDFGESAKNLVNYGAYGLDTDSNVLNAKFMEMWNSDEVQKVVNGYGASSMSYGKYLENNLGFTTDESGNTLLSAREADAFGTRGNEENSSPGRTVNVYNLNDALGYALTGSHSAEDLQNTMNSLKEKYGVESPDELQQKLAHGEVTIEQVAIDSGMDQRQLEKFARTLGIAEGLLGGSVVEGKNGYYAGGQLVAGKWSDGNAVGTGYGSVNIQGGNYRNNDPLIGPFMGNYINANITGGLAFMSPVPKFRTNFILGFAVNTANAGINWANGYGDGVTFSSNVITSAGTTGASIGVASLTSEFMAGILGWSNSAAKAAGILAGFAVGYVLDKAGLSSYLEAPLRELHDKDLMTPIGWYRNYETFSNLNNQMNLEYDRYQSQRYDYLNQIRDSRTWNNEMMWLNNRIKNERKGNYWTGIKG